MRLSPTDKVIEVGPGHGALTQFLLPKVNHLVTVEQDAKLAQELQLDFEQEQGLEVITADFLQYSLPAKGNYVVVGNIPFALTADIVRKLLLAPNPPSAAYIIMQYEAAQRLIGADDVSGMQSNFYALQFWPLFHAGIIYKFKRSDFSPKPNIDSVLIKISKRDRPLILREEYLTYLDFIAFCFVNTSGRMEKSLRHLFTANQLQIISKNLSLDLRLFPSELMFHDWLNLFHAFKNHAEKQRQRLIYKSFARINARGAKLQKQHRTRKRS